MDIAEIRELCAAQQIEWTQHIAKRLLLRGITAAEISTSIMNSEIIEDYPDDTPFPSCLLLGKTENGKSLHIVCAVGDGKLWMITVYEPRLSEWTHDFKKRKES